MFVIKTERIAFADDELEHRKEYMGAGLAVGNHPSRPHLFPLISETVACGRARPPSQLRRRLPTPSPTTDADPNHCPANASCARAFVRSRP